MLRTPLTCVCRCRSLYNSAPSAAFNNNRPRPNYERRELRRQDTSDKFGTDRPSDVEQRIRVSSNKRYRNWAHPEENEEDQEEECTNFVINKNHPDWYVQKCTELAAQGKLAEAVKMLEKRMLKEDKVTPTIRNFNVVLKPLAHIGQLDKVLRLHRLSEDYALKTSMATYTILLTACAKCDTKALAMEVVNEVKMALHNRERSLTPIHYNAFINAYAKHGELSLALQMFDEMVANKVKPTSSTFGHLLQSCYSLNDGLSLALKLWHQMLKADVRPSVHNFTDLLNIVANSNSDFAVTADKNEQSNTLDSQPTPNLIEHKSQSTPPESNMNQIVVNKKKLSEIARNNLLCDWRITATFAPPQPPTESHERLDYLGGLPGILAAMKHFNLSPNHRTLSVLLLILPNNLENEIMIINGLEQMNIEPDVQFFNQIMHRRAKRYAFDEARDILKQILSYRLKPDNYTFGALALCISNGKQIQQIFHDMKRSSVKPNSPIMLPLLLWTIKHRQFALAGQLLAKFRRLKIKPNARLNRTLNVAVNEMRKDIGDEHPVRTVAEVKFDSIYESWKENTIIDEENSEEKFRQELAQLDPDSLRSEGEKPWLTKNNVKYD